MGKGQSKRSVDITTEVKKDDVPEEGTGKMGKIEDIDQLKPHVNGDTNHSESDVGDKEKCADTDGTENEKDLSTEKEQQPSEPKTNLEGGDETKAEAATTPTGDKPMENGDGNDDTLNESKNANETTNENGDSSKKPKKEKVKKKWSLRSISFGKKDKQKPPKKEETTTNGECEKVPEEGTEEPTKNGDASAEENDAANASSDEKSPATSPVTESKDVTTPAVEATPAVESTPVLNGSSEHTKDEKPVAEVAPTVVAEEKASESVEVAAPVAPAVAVVEEPPKVEAAPEPVAAPVTESAPVVAAESAKTEEVPVATKIEVNAENVQDEIIENKSEVAQTASDQQQQGDIDKEDKNNDDELINQNIGGDSESAQNLPPPPLPCTSPPSQVSVFALSDDGSKGEPQKAEFPVPLPDVSDVKPEEITLATKEETAVTEIPECLPAAEVTKDEPQRIEENLEKSGESMPQEEISKEINISLQETSMEGHISAIGEQGELDKINEQGPTSSDLSESSIVNTEQIAQTLALIDEVTTEAAISVSNQLNEIKKVQIPNVEPALPELATSEIQNDESATLLPIHPSLPYDQTSVAPEEAVNLTETSNLVGVEVEANLQKEVTVAVSLNADAVADKVEMVSAPMELIGDHRNLTQTVDMNATSLAVKEEEKSSVTEQHLVANVDDSVEKAPLDEKDLTILSSPTATETEGVTEVANMKENGFGENHSAETSATESLNGQSDHKTIEEMKSDCSEKLASEPTTELAAGAIEVKE